jgi:predicted ATPase/DNA-binding winged helix-turn-helix (wHTH) protein
MPFPPHTGQIIGFRRYWLALGSRLLVADGTPVEIGARALDLLIALIEARGNPVSLAALKQAVWPHTPIASNTVQVLVSSLRKTLQDDADLIATVAGRGYRFTDTPQLIDASGMAHEAGPQGSAVAPVRGDPAVAAAAEAYSISSAPPQRLDETPFTGRHAELSELLALVSSRRVVSLIGAAGVGKTRLAAELAKRLHSRFRDGVVWLELATQMQAQSLAETLSMAVQREPDTAQPALERLGRLLGQRAILLIVDACDHLAEAVRHLLETLLAAAPALRIIVTSETPLFIAGEHVVALAPLATPAPGAGAAAAAEPEPETETKPQHEHQHQHQHQSEHEAPQPGDDALGLLLARLALALRALQTAPALGPRQGLPNGAPNAHQAPASPAGAGAQPALASDNAALTALPARLPPPGRAALAHICRQLDGLPFALELAASTIAQCTRAGVPLEVGLSAYALGLQDTLLRRSGARRVALPRAALVAAVLDLAYVALEPRVQVTLRRLGVCVGTFSAASANRLLLRFDADGGALHHRPDAAPPSDADSHAFDADLVTLLQAGLVERLAQGNQIVLRLPEPVRLLALAALDRRHAFDTAAQHHARHVAAELRALGDRRPPRAHAHHGISIDNLRAALGWAMRHDKFELCIALLEQSAPCWRACSLLGEYLERIGAVLAQVEAAPLRGMRDQMRLHCALASALTLKRVPPKERIAAWHQAYELANACADASYRLRALRGLLACALEDGRVDWARELHGTYARILADSPAGQLA